MMSTRCVHFFMGRVISLQDMCRIVDHPVPGIILSWLYLGTPRVSAVMRAPVSDFERTLKTAQAKSPPPDMPSLKY